MKYIWIFLVSLVLLFFSLASASAHSSTSVIKMTDGTFEPSEVTVDTNSTVIFLNQDTIDRWPASNLHPTHELFPEFDPKKGIAPSESWAFSPKKPGVWKYHDHLNPHIRGTLIVAAEVGTGQSFSGSNFWQNLRSRIISFFQKTFAKNVSADEFKKMTADKQFGALSTLAKKKGAKKSWDFLTETFRVDAGSSGNIHDLAHLTGKLIFEDKGVAGISVCTPVFAFGCYHGLLDAAFTTSLKDLPQAEAACEKAGPVNSGPYGSCIHGIGHGVASFHKTTDMKAALNSCDGLMNGRDFCYDGVFMEFVRGAPNTFYSKTDPFAPCSNLEKETGDLYSVPCGRNQPTVFIQKLGLTFESAVTLCGENALSDKFKNSCFDALGFILASSEDPQKIISGCFRIKNQNFQFLCLKSAAGELIFQEAPGWQVKSGQVCDALTGTLRTACHENLQRLIEEYER